MIVRPLQFNVFLYLLSLKIYRKQYILDLRTRLDGQFQKHRLGAPLPPPPQIVFLKKDSRFFRDPPQIQDFLTHSPGASPDLQKARRLATSRPPLEDSVLFYFFVRRSLHFRDSEVSALVVSLGDICNRYIQYLNKVPIATIILHI